MFVDYAEEENYKRIVGDVHSDCVVQMRLTLYQSMLAIKEVVVTRNIKVNIFIVSMH
jgi:hypothetical protein